MRIGVDGDQAADLDGDGVQEAVSGLEDEFGDGKVAGFAGSVTSADDWGAAFDLAEAGAKPPVQRTSISGPPTISGSGVPISDRSLPA